MTVLLVIFLSKALVAAACVGFGRATLGTMHGRASLSHAAMYAMAASHSFDVTLGIPLATELFPTLLPYVYANQVADKDNADALEEMKKSGKTTFVTLTPDEKAAWKAALEPVTADMAKRVGKDVIDEFQKEAKGGTQ